MKIDGVEFPDHVVEAFAKAGGMDYPVEAFREDEAPWFRQVMLGFLQNFYQGWKAREQYYPVEAQYTSLISRGMANKLHTELKNWLGRMQQSGAHPTVKELEAMVTMAKIVSHAVARIRESLHHEETGFG